MRRVMPLFFGHIMRRQDSLEKAAVLRKIKGSRKRRKPNIRWIDSLKEWTGLSLQEMSMAVKEKILQRSHIHKVTIKHKCIDDTQQ